MPETLITDLEAIEILAKLRHDEFEVMMYRLQYDDELADNDIDQAVEAVAGPIVEAIDCRKCANCCRSLTVQLGQDDVELLAAGTNMSLEAIITDHVNLIDDTETSFVIGNLRHQPCAFLKENLCSVYLHRPEACRVYPQFTPDFRWTLGWMLDGAGVCPIIYNVLDKFTKHLDEWQRKIVNNS